MQNKSYTGNSNNKRNRFVSKIMFNSHKNNKYKKKDLVTVNLKDKSNNKNFM